MPPLLDRLGILDRVLAATPGMTQDTINGLVAFMIPGPDCKDDTNNARSPAR